MANKDKTKSQTLLSVESIHLSFGRLVALHDVTMEFQREGIFAIIGPNGAGKTCIFNVISGFYRPQEGKVCFGGKDITRVPSTKRARLGIARTFQNIELYTGLSTVENLMAARTMLFRNTVLECGIHFGRTRREEIEHREVVEDVIDLLEIKNIRKSKVGLLPYGLRKRVELGRALAMEPKVLLLDEPMAGMNIEEKEDMARFIIDIYELKKICIILIEHDMDVLMDISEKIDVLAFGKKIAEGSPQEVAVNKEVVSAYLGEA
ncbi:MAG: ABC transporter ATP-binding protein [Thermodesulfobacteriota bacterium]|nr:ABC transporter ATP-binding protein [Thermodesulfobacteriota bacterium]